MRGAARTFKTARVQRVADGTGVNRAARERKPCKEPIVSVALGDDEVGTEHQICVLIELQRCLLQNVDVGMLGAARQRVEVNGAALKFNRAGKRVVAGRLIAGEVQQAGLFGKRNADKTRTAQTGPERQLVAVRGFDEEAALSSTTTLLRPSAFPSA